MPNSTSQTNYNSNSYKGEKLISNKNSAYDFARSSSYDDENNPSNFNDNSNISDDHKQKASPDFLLGQNLIDTKIPIHYQTPPHGPEIDQMRKMRNSNSNKNIHKLNYTDALNVDSYTDNHNCYNNICSSNSNENCGNKTTTHESLSICKNTQIKQAGKNIIDKLDMNNSFLAPNYNSLQQPDLISDYSQNLKLYHKNNPFYNYNNTNNKSNLLLSKNENIYNNNTSNAYSNSNCYHTSNRNTVSNKINKNPQVEVFDESLDLKYSNSNYIPVENKYNFLHSHENQCVNDALSENLNDTNNEKNVIKKRNLVKIFGKSILSVINHIKI